MSTVESAAGRRAARLAARYRAVRDQTLRLCEPLETEDYVVQSMADVSPTRWHLAHMTWFFETFVLGRHDPGYRPRRPEYEYLFNSYYNAVGDQFPRPRRGLLTRPTVAEILDYRRRVDEAIVDYLDSPRVTDEALSVVELGLHHEQQHQELLLMDIKHVLSCNPLHPAYRGDIDAGAAHVAADLRFLGFEGGLIEVGHAGVGFAFDNEGPRHKVWLEPYRLAHRLSTNGEYLAFVEDGGYRRPELWLADGWTAVLEQGWSAPLYWVAGEDGWSEFTLAGLEPLVASRPVVHLSYYEADAFARWAGVRLPREEEWEGAVGGGPPAGHFVEERVYHPRPAAAEPGDGLQQAFGDVWEWTASPYSAYPGFAAPSGALGEYNGKFMCGQFVLRGGACVTPRDHVRATYRNFFYPSMRWQFGGVRLAEDA